MKKFRKNNKGFTLVELIIVIAIIAVLSAVLAPQYIAYVEKSRLAMDDSVAAEVKHNVEILAVDAAVYDEIADDDTVSFTDGDAITSTCDKLEEELLKVYSGDIDMKSKTRKDATYTVTIGLDATTGALSFTEAWS